MRISQVDKVTRLVGLFTLLLTATILGGGWYFHGRLEAAYEESGGAALLAQGQILRLAVETRLKQGEDPARFLEDLRQAAGLDRLDLVAPDWRPLAGDFPGPVPLPPDSLRPDLQLGLDLLLPPWREDGEIYQSLYLPLPGDEILFMQSGEQVSTQLDQLRRGLWIATLAGTLFVLFVLLAMAIILRQARLRQFELDHAEHLARIGALAAGLAHEIRNPLAIIAGQAEMVEIRGGDEDSLRRSREIIEETERLQRLLDGFLSFARPQDISPRAVPAPEFWRRVLLEQEVLHPGISYALDCDDHLPPLLADPDALRQIALNLLGNAAAATDGKGQVAVELSGNGDFVTTRVGDSGPGVSPELAERIFEPFVSGRENGTGLGLAVARALARGHGGDLQLGRSDLGGAGFILTLRASPVAADNKQGEKP